MKQLLTIYFTIWCIYSNSQNVGIGTTTPDSTLHVLGGLKLETGRHGIDKVLISDATGGADWGFPTKGMRFGVSGEDNSNASFNANRLINMKLRNFIWDSVGTYLIRTHRSVDTTNMNFSINHTTRQISLQTGNARWQTFYKQQYDDILGSIVFIEANKTTSSSHTAFIQLAGIDTSIHLEAERIVIFLDTSHTALETNAGIFIASSQLPYRTHSALNGVYIDTITGEIFRGPATANLGRIGNIPYAPTGDTTKFKLLVKGVDDNQIYWTYWPASPCNELRKPIKQPALKPDDGH